MMMPLHHSRRLLLAASGAALAGCSRLFVSPPPRYVFRLTPVATFPPGLPHVDRQLLVALPAASAALDRRRIALTRSPLALDYFADAEWADSLSQLVQAVLSNSFENSGAITVIDGSLGLREDFALGTEIRHFEAQYGAGGGPPNVVVSVAAKLVAMPAREVVAQSLFERQKPAPANDLPSIAAAFDAALGAVASAIVVWAVRDAASLRARRRL